MFALKTTIPKVFSTIVRGKHTLPKLPYDYKALEPIISCEILEVHHGKHHQAYVNNLNAAEEQLADARSNNDLNKIVTVSEALKFNYGGHVNHSLYWQNLTPEKTEPSAALKKALEQQFGSFEEFKKQLSALSVAVKGSGWGLLGYNKKMKNLQIVTVSNQDPFEAGTGLIPLFTIDVWEHAYYLQYKNLRPKYVESIWEIANWNDVSQRYQNAICN